MKNTKIQILKSVVCLSVISAVVSCSKDDESTGASGRYLYVATGACYSGGGNTTFTNLTSSNVVYRVDLGNGDQQILADYNSSPAQTGDSPVAIADYDDTTLYVLVENTTTTGARRVERLAKSVDGDRTLFSNNVTALSAQLRSLFVTGSGDLVVSKSTAVEKITSANVRITQGANPFINAPAGSCATSTTLISKVIPLTNGNLVFLHAATGQNRIGIISSSGYSVVGDCKTGVSAPNASSFPVAGFYDSANAKLIVAYAGSSTADNINTIYAYDVDENNNTITNPQEIYDSNGYPTTYPYLLYGVTHMSYDSTTGHIYVATAVNTATTIQNYAIEKFAYNPSQIGSSNTTVLTRAGSTPFFDYGVDTKCISSMFID